MPVKSEAPEPLMHWMSSYFHMECPFCKVHNVVDLGNLADITAVDVEACQCHGCSKKFWLPEEKYTHETNASFGFDPFTEEELGLEPGQDLIESAVCEIGKPREQ